MKLIAPLAFGVALAAGAALAQPINENPPTRTIMCIDVGGRSLPVSCRVPGSRLDPREYICVCDEGRRVEVSICPQGVKAPPEGVALMRARREVLRSQRDLVGADFQGRPMCVAPRESALR